MRCSYWKSNESSHNRWELVGMLCNEMHNKRSSRHRINTLCFHNILSDQIKKVKPTHREKNISAMMPSHNVWVTNEWANCGALSKFTVLINSDAGPSPWLAFAKVQLMFVLCAAIQEIRWFCISQTNTVAYKYHGYDFTLPKMWKPLHYMP